MARVWRAYHPDLPHAGEATVSLSSDESHHVQRVLRLSVGDSLGIFDGRGLERQATITSIEIREALSQPVRKICESIRQVLEETPPEISADLVDSGCTIVGGGALLYGIAPAVSEFLGIPARVSEDPLTAVARGTGVFLEKLDVFSRVLSTDDED